MSRSVKITVLLLMLILVPLHSVALATAGVCDVDLSGAMTHDDGSNHDHGTPHHHHGFAGEHCGNAAFAAPPASIEIAGLAASERISSSQTLAAGFVPDHLDPPPLAL